jgi:hypothetical protein
MEGECTETQWNDKMTSTYLTHAICLHPHADGTIAIGANFVNKGAMLLLPDHIYSVLLLQVSADACHQRE